MIADPRPRFEVVVGTASAEDRRLISLATLRALTGITEAAMDDATLTILLDSTLAQAARYCRLAADGTTPPTFARETVRATWDKLLWWDWCRAPGTISNSQLVLPWRVPITAISVADGDTPLVENTDFRLLGGNIIQRVGGGLWPTTGPVVVDYTAGWVAQSSDASYESLDDPMPADVVAAIADQVRLSVSARGRDPGLRSEDIPGVWSGTFNVAGGDSIAEDGLLYCLQAALAPYRNKAMVA